MQVAAISLSLGGGFQVYINQNSDESAKQTKSRRLVKVAEFMHKRKLCYANKPVAQLGVFYSAESRYKKSNIFNQSSSTQCLIGALNCILDTQYTANTILEYQIERLSEYDIVVIPEWEFINDENKKRFLEYVQKGGNHLVIGAEISEQFGKITNEKITLLQDDNVRYIMDTECEFAQIRGSVLALLEGTEPMYADSDMRYQSIPAYNI